MMKTLLALALLIPSLAFAELCDGPGPCDPGKVNAMEFDVQNIVCETDQQWWKLQVIPPIDTPFASKEEVCQAILDAVVDGF